MTMPGSPARPSFSVLRGARWRADLGVLPDSAAVSINELRRAAADSRRRYANLRRRLLIDPHLSKDEEAAPDLIVENPLSQNPESTWGQYFRNAELEKMLNQDLSRLYPELGGFFQTSTCQSMLGRILLVWSLRYPEFGYRQGKALASSITVSFSSHEKNVDNNQRYLQHDMPKRNRSGSLELAPRSLNLFKILSWSHYAQPEFSSKIAS